MARPRKISEEELLNIINKFLENNPYITTLKYSELVEYAKLELGYENITYQDFSRNSTAKEFIEVYKQRKDMTSYIKLNEDKLEKFNFDVESLVDKYKGNPKQLKAILKVFKEGYDRAFILLNKYEETHNNDVVLIKEQEKIIKDLKEKNTKLRKELNGQKINNSSSYRIEKLKWMYLTVKDMIERSNFYIETEDEVLDILKNFGYSSNDIVDVEKIIEEEFSTEEIISKLSSNVIKGECNSSRGNAHNLEDKVIPFKKSTTELELPDFMK